MVTFRNVTDETLEVYSLGVYVKPGEQTPELDDDQAAGFVLQGDTWHAVGDAARAAQLAQIEDTQAQALLTAAASADLTPPPESAAKQVWVDYAAAVVRALGGDDDAVDAARQVAKSSTKAQLIAELGNTKES